MDDVILLWFCVRSQFQYIGRVLIWRFGCFKI